MNDWKAGWVVLCMDTCCELKSLPCREDMWSVGRNLDFSSKWKMVREQALGLSSVLNSARMFRVHNDIRIWPEVLRTIPTAKQFVEVVKTCRSRNHSFLGTELSFLLGNFSDMLEKHLKEMLYTSNLHIILSLVVLIFWDLADTWNSYTAYSFPWSRRERSKCSVMPVNWKLRIQDLQHKMKWCLKRNRRESGKGERWRGRMAAKARFSFSFLPESWEYILRSCRTKCEM